MQPRWPLGAWGTLWCGDIMVCMVTYEDEDTDAIFNIGGGQEHANSPECSQVMQYYRNLANPTMNHPQWRFILGFTTLLSNYMLWYQTVQKVACFPSYGHWRCPPAGKKEVELLGGCHVWHRVFPRVSPCDNVSSVSRFFQVVVSPILLGPKPTSSRGVQGSQLLIIWSSCCCTSSIRTYSVHVCPCNYLHMSNRMQCHLLQSDVGGNSKNQYPVTARQRKRGHRKHVANTYTVYNMCERCRGGGMGRDFFYPLYFRHVPNQSPFVVAHVQCIRGNKFWGKAFKVWRLHPWHCGGTIPVSLKIERDP